uniref:Adenosine 3'-phospho 5'-phosphosulfate transporter 1 n=1 Tax=Macrostomum lignano TaxID=282301 RepID=A0A1I8H493_9PLAT
MDRNKKYQSTAFAIANTSYIGHWWWLGKLVANLFGYATVLLAIYFAVQFWKQYCNSQHDGNSNKTVQPGSAEAKGPTKESAAVENSPNSVSNICRLVGCFLGLQAAYLTWGVLQEQVMTTVYHAGDGTAGAGEKFTDSQFLVFTNRLLAGCVATCLLVACRLAQGDNSSTSAVETEASVLDYAYCSLSNVLSAWCQYEALLFVSFPTQVLAKACKIVPVMLMGKLVSRRTYRLDEYGTAVLISAGTSIFLLSSSSKSSVRHHQSVSGDSLSGSALLAGYMLFDSHPRFLGHVTLLSVCSAVGQLLIFYTIERFGPVTFSVIMTVRQAFAILLSCLLFGHPFGGVWGCLGLAGVFLALFLRICLSQRAKKRSREDESRSGLVPA